MKTFLTGILVAVVVSLSLGAAASAESQICIKPKKVLVETAPSPSGAPWRVQAALRNNGDDCNQWLFQVQFRLPRVVSWASGTGIPIHGHTSRYFDISALDAESPDGSERVFSGYTGREVATIVVTFTDGQRSEITPKYPPVELRRRCVWMRSFRYFVFYYPPGVGIETVSLFTKGKRLLYRAQSEEGFF